MDASLLAVLTDAERLTVAETEAARLTALDEDAAIELETRIRRARDKYVGQYRRAASLRVPEQGGRGTARPMNTRAAMKAEAFEEALARTSRRVAACRAGIPVVTDGLAPGSARRPRATGPGPGRSGRPRCCVW